MMIKKSLDQYIAEAKSGNPTPGGGSVAALAGSLGAALTVMVGNLTIDKKSFEAMEDLEKEELQANFKKLDLLIEDFNMIVDEDTHAFDGVMRAFKLAKETDQEKEERSKAIEEGYKLALEVPLRCSSYALEALELQKIFAEKGNINALTDVGVGSLLLYTALESSLMNVLINLKGIKDNNYKKEVEKEMESTLEKGKILKENLLKIVYERLS